MAINNASIFMPIGKRRLIEGNKCLINNNLRLAEIKLEGMSRFYFIPEISGFPGCFPGTLNQKDLTLFYEKKTKAES
jgi:hypothetical protein